MEADSLLPSPGALPRARNMTPKASHPHCAGRLPLLFLASQAPWKEPWAPAIFSLGLCIPCALCLEQALSCFWLPPAHLVVSISLTNLPGKLFLVIVPSPPLRG